MAGKYDRIVKASLALDQAESSGKFALAEALALDIPERDQHGRHREVRRGERKGVPELIVEAQQKIIAAGGEPRSTDTMMTDRFVALWAQEPAPDSRAIGKIARFRWRKDVTFTIHKSAWNSGLDFGKFTAMSAKELKEQLAQKHKIHCCVCGKATGEADSSYRSACKASTTALCTTCAGRDQEPEPEPEPEPGDREKRERTRKKHKDMEEERKRRGLHPIHAQIREAQAIISGILWDEDELKDVNVVEVREVFPSIIKNLEEIVARKEQQWAREGRSENPGRARNNVSPIRRAAAN